MPRGKHRGFLFAHRVAPQIHRTAERRIGGTALARHPVPVAQKPLIATVSAEKASKRAFVWKRPTVDRFAPHSPGGTTSEIGTDRLERLVLLGLVGVAAYFLLFRGK